MRNQAYIQLHVEAKYPEMTTDLARRYLRSILLQRGPEFVYPWIEESTHRLWDGNECHYVRDGEPSCAFGMLLARHGVPAADIHQYEGKSIEEAMQYLGVPCKIGLALAMRSAQSVQDDKRTYKEMYAEFLDAVKEHGV